MVLSQAVNRHHSSLYSSGTSRVGHIRTVHITVMCGTIKLVNQVTRKVSKTAGQQQQDNWQVGLQLPVISHPS